MYIYNNILFDFYSNQPVMRSLQKLHTIESILCVEIYEKKKDRKV